MKKYRIKSYRADSHFVQQRYFGLFWGGIWGGRGVRWDSLYSAMCDLKHHVHATRGYPKVTKPMTEEGILNGKS